MADKLDYRRLAEWLANMAPERWKMSPEGISLLYLPSMISLRMSSPQHWDLNFCRLAEEEISQQGLRKEYLDALWARLPRYVSVLWCYVHATADLKIESMLEVIHD